MSEGSGGECVEGEASGVRWVVSVWRLRRVE